MRFLRKRWYVMLVVLLAAGIYMFSRNSANGATKKDATYKVTRQTLRETLSLSGVIDAQEQAVLRFPSSGRLVWVGVKEGDYVTKGQGIASLDKRDIQARMQKYLNTYSSTRITYDQSKDDNREVVIGGLTVDQRQRTLRAFQKNQNDLNNAVLDVELQQLAAEDAYLSSPINGIVTKIDTPNAGVNITPTSGEFVVVNPDTLYFSALADQTEVVKLRQGMYGKVTLDSFPDDDANATVDTISFTPKTGESGTVYQVKIMLSGTDMTVYRLGMTGDVEFTLKERKGVLSVPLRYVRTESDKDYVWKMVKGAPVKTYIQTGLSSDTDIEVISGIDVGDVIYDKTS